MAHIWVLEGPLTLGLESPFWGPSQETAGFINPAANESPSQNCPKCPPRYPKGWKLSAQRKNLISLRSKRKCLENISISTHFKDVRECLGAPKGGNGKWWCWGGHPQSSGPEVWEDKPGLGLSAFPHCFPKNREVMLGWKGLGAHGSQPTVWRARQWLSEAHSHYELGLEPVWWHNIGVMTPNVTQIKKAFLGSLPPWLCQHSLPWLDFEFKTAQVMKSYLSLLKEHFRYF